MDVYELNTGQMAVGYALNNGRFYEYEAVLLGKEFYLCAMRITAYPLKVLPGPLCDDKGKAKEHHSHCQAEHRNGVLYLVLHEIAPCNPDVVHF
jgi:hypothetical protein